MYIRIDYDDGTSKVVEIDDSRFRDDEWEEDLDNVMQSRYPDEHISGYEVLDEANYKTAEKLTNLLKEACTSLGYTFEEDADHSVFYINGHYVDIDFSEIWKESSEKRLADPGKSIILSSPEIPDFATYTFEMGVSKSAHMDTVKMLINEIESEIQFNDIETNEYEPETND